MLLYGSGASGSKTVGGVRPVCAGLAPRRGQNWAPMGSASAFWLIAPRQWQTWAPLPYPATSGLTTALLGVCTKLPLRSPRIIHATNGGADHAETRSLICSSLGFAARRDSRCSSISRQARSSHRTVSSRRHRGCRGARHCAAALDFAGAAGPRREPSRRGRRDRGRRREKGAARRLHTILRDHYGVLRGACAA